MVDLQEPAQRMRADYHARTPGQFFGEPLDLRIARVGPIDLAKKTKQRFQQSSQRIILFSQDSTDTDRSARAGIPH